jgi:hypothetical protein
MHVVALPLRSAHPAPLARILGRESEEAVPLARLPLQSVETVPLARLPLLSVETMKMSESNLSVEVPLARLPP